MRYSKSEGINRKRLEGQPSLLLKLKERVDPKGALLLKLKERVEPKGALKVPLKVPRKVLLNQIKAGDYERTLAQDKVHNFPKVLPKHLTL